MIRLKRNKIFLISITILTLLLVIIVVGSKIFIDINRKVKKSTEALSENTSDEWKWESATKPEWGRLYLTADNNESGIYYTNEEVMKNQISFNPKTTPYYGEFIGLKSHRRFDGYYHFLSNPRPFSHDIYILSVGPLVNVNESNLYYAFIYWKAGEDNEMQSAIYKIDTENLTIEKVWTNKFTGFSGDYKGMVGLDSVLDDKYLLAHVSSCLDCGAAPYGKTIINISTGNDIYLEDITELDVNLDTNSFSYQKLYPVKEKCEPDELSWTYCDENGMKIIKKPGDQVFTQTLP